MDKGTKRAAGVAGFGRWARRFMSAAIIQGAAVVGLTIFLVLGQAFVKPEVSRVIAGGGAGTWFSFGYLTYIIVGVIGVAVSSLFYHYLEQGNGRFGRVFSALGWTHLILMNAGVTATSSMMMLAGYLGGAAMLPLAVGGQGFDAAQAHGILAPYVEPLGASILVLTAGVLAGGLGFLIAFRCSPRTVSSSTKGTDAT